MHLHSSDSDSVAVINGQDGRLTALQIFKPAFFRKLPYLILKVLILDPRSKICFSSQHEQEMTHFVLFCSKKKKPKHKQKTPQQKNKNNNNNKKTKKTKKQKNPKKPQKTKKPTTTKTITTKKSKHTLLQSNDLKNTPKSMVCMNDLL